MQLDLFGNVCDHFAETDEFAPAGPDGARAAALLAEAKRDGAEVFAAACESAVNRLLANANPLDADVLFTDEELADIADALSRGIATADLLGRVRVRRRAEMAKGKEGFAESDGDPFDVFEEAVPSLAPEAAVGYFTRLVPALGKSVVRYGPRLDRHAFTLAVASDQVILDRVKAAILKELTTGEKALPAVQDILDAAGVSVKNPQYSEMVVRSNVLSALNEGQAAELAEPEMQEAFPVWMYDGIRDGRQGKDHEPHFGKYFPSTTTFSEVRGPRIFNCRCGHTPIYKGLWEDMQRRGVRVETQW
jgi:hypothetical protein